MNGIDWDALKKAVSDYDEQTTKTQKTKGVGVTDYSLELNGVSIDVEVRTNNVYAMRRRLLAYYKRFQRMKDQTEEVKNLYKSIFDFLVSDYQHLCDSMKEDVDELDTCYSSGAYKATLILAGSALEAFLLDWLSEIDGKNYFEEPYKIRVQKADGTYRWEKKDQLNVYIDQIKELERPDWMESSEKAHFIRKSRNSVHAKVCLKREIDINKETCRKVITYLKEIVDTRLEKRKQELSL